MTLIVEDGTGLADAEAYISAADATTYFAARGNAVWAALDTDAQEQALRKGADYMGAVYGQRWIGSPLTTTQALDWPRTELTAFPPWMGFDSDPVVVPMPIPVAIGRANAELAVRASQGDLLGDQGTQVLREQVGPISVTYANGARQDVRYVFVDGMLAPYLQGAGQIPVVRA